MNVIEKEDGSRVFSWCPDIDENTLGQILRASRLPFVRHAAAMPDAHHGESICIGGVVACEKTVVPYFVGSDAGCGMCTVKTSLKACDFSMDARWRYLDLIEKLIPVSFVHNDDRRTRFLKGTMGQKFLWDALGSKIADTKSKPLESSEDAYFSQLGTMGGGNHMAELDVDPNGNVWILLHSGSRNIGKRICDYYDNMAKELNRRWHSSVPEDIGFLPTDCQEGDDYIRWMNFALAFAFRNRQVMVDEMKSALEQICPNVTFEKPINIHHNYASQERHFGKDLWVHRKGATLADKGTMGIIPGSMGTATYVVRGLGNPQSLNSCSHGAGWKFGRIEFNKANNNEEALAAIEKAMEGIVYRKFKKDVNRKGKETGMLDVAECPFAYKDIDAVIAAEADLVEPVVRMTPIVVMKG